MPHTAATPAGAAPAPAPAAVPAPATTTPAAAAMLPELPLPEQGAESTFGETVSLRR
jgi:hypothetical protein